MPRVLGGNGPNPVYKKEVAGPSNSFREGQESILTAISTYNPILFVWPSVPHRA